MRDCLPSRLHSRALSLALAIAACACNGTGLQEAPGESEPAPEPDQPNEPDEPSGPAAQEAARNAERDACRAMRSNVASMPALAGTPELDGVRHQVLGRTKGWPVVFRRKPLRDEAMLTPYFRWLAASLDDPRQAFATLKTLRKLASHRRAEVRATLLPEGYFYSEDASAAHWMVTHFKLQTLFDEPEIFLLRGSNVHRLVRSELGYRYAEGAKEGKLASLLLFDRVAVDRKSLLPALHADFVPAARSHGFDRLRIERITPIGINAQLRYGPEGPWVSASFTVVDARPQLACEIVQEASAAVVRAFRHQQRIRERAAEALRAAARAQAVERLPFDEPKEEVGQQDGSLRPKWEWSYRHGGMGYAFNEVWYPVFDTAGRPHPPQVCVDFILDTYERAAGAWYGNREEPRARTTGTVDFGTMEIPNRRSVEAVADFFRENPGTFELWDLRPEQRVRFASKEAFFDFILEHADQFRVNSVVLIHGPRGEEAHYHSVMVYQVDPMNGMPVVLAENAGKPRIRSWQSVMQTGPLRSVKHVMTPRIDWLDRSYPNVSAALASNASGEIDD